MQIYTDFFLKKNLSVRMEKEVLRETYKESLGRDLNPRPTDYKSIAHPG